MSVLDSEEGPIADINITPLVDVALVLVIIFMVVAPFIVPGGIKASPAQQQKALDAEAAPKPSNGRNVSIALESESRIKINNRLVKEEAFVRELTAALNVSDDKNVSLMAANSVRVARVVEVLDIAKQLGAKKLAILKLQNK